MEKKEKNYPELDALTSEETVKTEIYPGMTVEEINAVFFDTDALREPPYRVYQLNGDGHRYYYRFDESGEPVFYPSVTTLLNQVMPTSPFLIEWMLANGKEGAVEKRDLAAAYGTFMHIQFERLIVNREYDFDAVPGELLAYMEQNNLPDKFYGDSLTKIRKDVLAFAQFVRDYNVKPLAIEIGLVSPTYHFAGCVDMPCVMTDPKTGRSYTAIVDFKSGRKGFYEEHELQLHLYRMMWDENFPQIKIERLYNFSPKDWRTKPTYNLKDQTESVNAAKIPHLLALAMIEDEKRDNTLTIVRGRLDLDSGKIADNVLTLSLAELIKSKSESVDKPGESAVMPDKGQNKPVESKTPPETGKPTPVRGNARKTAKKEGITGEPLPWENPNGATADFIPPKPDVKDNLLNDEIDL